MTTMWTSVRDRRTPRDIRRRLIGCALAATTLVVTGAAAAPTATLESSSETSVRVTVTFDPPTFENAELHGETWRVAHVPGLDTHAEVGWPGVPVHTVMVGVPPDRDVVGLSARPSGVGRQDGPPLRPVPGPDAKSLDELIASPVWREDGWQGMYPAERARVRTVTWWRNRRIAILDLFPLRTRPGEHVLEAASSLSLELTFGPPTGEAEKTLPARYGDDGWDALIDGALVNGPQSRRWLRSEAPAPPLRGTPGFSASTRWLRIDTEAGGICRVLGSQILGAGLPLPTDAASIRVFTGPARPISADLSAFDPDAFMDEVAILVEDGGDDDIDVSDRIEFFATSVDGYLIDIDPDAVALADSTERFEWHMNEYTSRRTYWMTWDAAFPDPPRRMSVVDVAPSGTPVAERDWVTRRTHIERNRWYDPGPKRSGERWEKWWWDEGTTSQDGDRLIRFDLPGHDAGAAGRLRGRLWADVNVAHRVTMSFNGNAWPELTWSGRSAPYDFDVAWSAGERFVLDGANQFTIRATTAPGVFDQIYLAWFELWEKYRLRWGGRDLVYRSPALDGRVRYRVSNLPDASADVLDVTDPLNPIRLTGSEVTGSGGTTTLTFDRTEVVTTSRRYLIAHSTTRISPVVVRAWQPPNGSYLRDLTDPVDAMIVYYDDFSGAADLLAALREDVLPGVESPRVLLAPISQVFAEFSGGSKDPGAIRRFVKFAYDRYRDPGAPASPRLRYVTLLGDASFDRRNFQLASSEDFVPAWAGRHSISLWFQDYTASWPSDDYFGIFGDLDDDPPSVSIGRIPAQTPSGATAMVTKTRQHVYGSARDDWRSRAVMVADDICQRFCLDRSFLFTHTRQAERDLIPYVPSEMWVERIYLVDYPDPVTGLECRGVDKSSARDALLGAINAGTWLVDYVGHGGSTQMSDEKVLLSSDVPAMQNAGRYHYFVTASCSVGKFDEGGEGLGETIVKQPGGGAVLSLSAAAVAGSSANVALNRRLLTGLFRSGSVHPDSLRTFGEAFLLARIEGAGASNDTKYNILGDPATSMAWPGRPAELTLSLPDARGGAAADTLWRGERMTVSGRVLTLAGDVDTGYTGTARVEVFDSEERRIREDYVTDDPPECDGGPVTVRPTNYSLPGATIYRADVPVVNGVFEAPFRVPAGLRRGERGQARIRCHVNGTGGTDAFASLDGIFVPEESRPGWSPDDVDPPEITLTLDGPAAALPIRSDLHLGFTDESGINITQLLDSRSAVMTIEEPGGFAVVTIDLAPEIVFGDDYREAEVTLPIPTALTVGRPYTIRVRASDNLGNRAQITQDVFLVANDSAEVQRVFAYPNPTGGAPVGFFVDVAVAIDVELKLYTVSGKLIRTLDASRGPGEGRLDPILWDLRDEDRDRVANGSYHYVVAITPRDGGERETRTGWLAVLR